MASEQDAVAGNGIFLDSLIGQIQNILTDAHGKGENFALMLVHVAAIDRIDAQHGFAAGNRFSDKFAEVLRSQALRKRDEIVNLSRDEFACILPAVPSQEIARLAAQRVMRQLGATPLDFGVASELADIAIGIAMFPEHGSDAKTSLQRAKHALLTARDSGDKIWIYEPRNAGSKVDQSQYAKSMRLALEQNSLAMHFMPQMSLLTGRLTGAEALLRWKDNVLGSLTPYDAVQIAESCGLIDQLSQWIITSVVQQCAQFQSIVPEFTVSVNISPSNLHELDLPLYIDRALRTWGVNSSNLIIEITESAMITDQKAANQVLHEFKSYGMKLSIDDFGTGYSSINYLAEMPLDELKIDMSFVQNMLEVPGNAKIVRSLIDLAHNFDLAVVAEGVENAAILAALAELGCDYAQGYHIGKAMPAADLAELLSQQAKAK